MDLTFKTSEGRFNYRACAVIINNNKILAMKDKRSPYYYLPGGRVALHESAEDALLRELEEELHVKGMIVRPLWLNQSFFTEDVTGERFHEICVYFLVDVSDTYILKKGESFISNEGKRSHTFIWLPFENLKQEYFYPNFIKTEIFNLPAEFTIRTEIEE